MVAPVERLRPRPRLARLTPAELVRIAAVALALGTPPLLPRGAGAQDAHYWSQQYGTRSELLGGTVVGSPQDLSTTYYNPGGLAFLEDQSFLLSALALEYEAFQLEREQRSSEVGADRFGPAPILVTGTLPRDWVPGTLAYTYLSRQKLEARIDVWRELAAGADPPVGNFLIDARVSENWGGLTWARRRGAIGIGVSGYVAYRSQRGREEFLSQPVPTDVPITALTTVNDYSYWHVRALAKIGVHWEREGATLGVSVTTPGLPLFGGGEAAFYRRLDVYQPAGPGVDEAEVAEDPEVEYRSPFSVAMGSRIEAGRAAIYLTAEWFDAVDRYRVLSAAEIPTSGAGSSLNALVSQELSSVLNAGVGAEFAPRENMTLFGSFITDFSGTNGDPATSHSFATWDIHQLTAGAAFSALRADFTLGLSWGGGSNPIDRINDVDPTPLLPSGSIRYERWKFFLGFEFRGQGASAEEAPGP